MGHFKQVLTLPSASMPAGNTNTLTGNDPQNNPYLTIGLKVADLNELLILVNQTVGTGVLYYIDTADAFGNWFTIATIGTALTGTGQWNTTLSGANSAASAFGDYVRLRWSATATFSATIFGK